MEGEITEKTYSLLAISKELRTPESTLRYYVRKFDKFIPITGEGRNRRYRPEAIEVLRTIADGFRNNQSVNDITIRLSLNFPQNIDIRDDRHDPSLTKYSPRDFSLFIKDIIEVQRDTVHELVAKDKILLEYKADLDQKYQEVTELRIQITELRIDKKEAEKLLQEKNQAMDRAGKEIRRLRFEVERVEELKVKADRAKDRAKELEVEVEKLKRPWWKRIFNK